ncbi:MAG: molybdopterin-synthase adenylyltransferase MoeB [Verrucomicrobiota bacterium]
MSFIPDIEDRVDGITMTNEEVKRYSRHLIMPEVTLSGQKKLKASKVLVVGTGGLGSPLLAYLTAAGVGNIGLCDFDVVDTTNLQRQIIHKSSNVGKSKVSSAIETMKDINPHVNVIPFETSFRSDNALEIAKDFDVILDGTDNFATRYLVNDACVLLGKPNVYGSIFRFDGQVTVFWGEKGPCYRCLYPEPPDPGLVPSCAEGGVLGVLPGVIGVLQAIETIKIICGIGDPMIGRLLIFDALKMRFREMKLRKDPNCPICGENPTITELVDYNQFCGTAPVDEPEQKHLTAPEVTPDELVELKKNDPSLVILDVREQHEYEIAHIPEAKLIPLNELPKRIHELDTAHEIVIYCKGEQRTEDAYRKLQQAGFKKLRALEGGIDAWAEDIDPDMPTY